MASRALTDLDTRLQPTAVEFVQRVNLIIAPSSCKIMETYRGPDEQKSAKAKGASKASYGKSPHNCVDKDGKPAARGFDFGIFDAGGSYVTDGKDVRYAKGGIVARALGLDYGGDWTIKRNGCSPDYDHVQMKAWKSVSPLE